eukprot:1159188-Pelagomonas_calceolata.AAC.6
MQLKTRSQSVFTNDASGVCPHIPCKSEHVQLLPDASSALLSDDGALGKLRSPSRQCPLGPGALLLANALLILHPFTSLLWDDKCVNDTLCAPCVCSWYEIAKMRYWKSCALAASICSSQTKKKQKVWQLYLNWLLQKVGACFGCNSGGICILLDFPTIYKVILDPLPAFLVSLLLYRFAQNRNREVKVWHNCILSGQQGFLAPIREGVSWDRADAFAINGALCWTAMLTCTMSSCVLSAVMTLSLQFILVYNISLFFLLFASGQSIAHKSQKVSVVSLGSQGCVARSSSGEVGSSQAQKVKVVDTCSAGA